MSKTTQGMLGPLTMPPQGIYEISSTQKLPLGRRLQLGERTFHYTEAGGTALVAGSLNQSPVPAADHLTLAVATAVAGVTEVTVTNGASTAVTVNMYRGGYMWIDAGTDNFGHMYVVKQNTAAAVNADFVVTLYDPLVEALTAAQETVALVMNPYKDVIIHPAVPTAHVVGASVVDVTADYYCWLQTWGPCPIITEGTLVIGEHAAVGDGTNGGVQPADTDVEHIVGDVMRVSAAAAYSLVYLRLAP